MSIERKNTGDKLKIAASDWNELARTADVVEEMRNRQGAGGGSRPRLDPTSVWVKNTTAGILLPGSIVGLASLAIDLAVGEWPAFEIGTPGADGRIGILVDALPADTTTLARCVVSGVVRTVVNVSDAAHLFAVPNGTYDSLDSSAAGNVRIIWADGTGDGVDALVRIEAGPNDCKIPIALRIDGGDATAGYDATEMEQIEGDPGNWQVKPDGFTTSGYGIKTFEANDAIVVAGARIYQGWYDSCRNVSHFYATDRVGSGSDSGSSGSSGSDGSGSTSGSGSSGSGSGSDTSGSQSGSDSGSGCGPCDGDWIEVVTGVTVQCVANSIVVTETKKMICVAAVCP